MALRRLLINTESAAAAQHNNALKGNQFTSPLIFFQNPAQVSQQHRNTMDGGYRSWTRPRKIENNSPGMHSVTQHDKQKVICEC